MSTSDSDKQKQRRRNILKAATAVPAIFTLPTGAALAQTSLTCVDKSKVLAAQNPPMGATTAADTWVRFSVAKYKIKLQDSSKVFAFTLNSQWYSVTGATNAIANVTLTRDPTYDPRPQTGGYFLLVDQSKYQNQPNSPQSFVFLGSENQVTSPVAGNSCWNSVTPSNQINSTVLNSTVIN